MKKTFRVSRVLNLSNCLGLRPGTCLQEINNQQPIKLSYFLAFYNKMSIFKAKTSKQE